MNKRFYSIYINAHNNAIDLLDEAKILYNKKHFPRAFFLAFTSLEEIAKSQLAADVYTGFITEETFLLKYNFHDQKINSVTWAYLDANQFLDKDNIPIKVSKPKLKKRMLALYVDINKQNEIISPRKFINEKDVKEIIHIVEIALYQIMITNEYYGHNIGTKGFMK